MKIFHSLDSRLKRSIVLKSIMLLFLVVSMQTFGQTGDKIAGKVVTDDGLPLPGVTVRVQGTQKGAISDADGKFTIDAQSGEVLSFTFIGYTEVIIPVNNQTQVNVTMYEETTELGEFVVVGYGTQRKSLVTGSISKVTNEKLDQIPLSRVDDALVGQVAGVNIQQTNPAAGEAPTLRIRGPGSITSFSDPLVVVDGLVVDSDYLGNIDMNDVESLEILKDAASAAIYGSRGANGIVMITTKSGKEGPTVFSYNSYVGFKSVPKNDVLSTVDDWTSMVRANNNGELTEKLKYIELLGTSTDWEDVMYDGGIINSHSLSVKGGTKNTKYRSSASYLKDEGVLLTDEYEKVNFSLNMTTKVNEKVEFGITLNPSFTNQRRFPIGLHDAIRSAPWLPLYLDENNIQYVNRERENGRWADAKVGDYAMERMFDNYDMDLGAPVASGGTSISTTSNASSLAKVLEREYRKVESKIFSNIFLKFNLTNDLFFKTSFGGDFRYRKYQNWTGVKASRNGAADSESTISTLSQTHIVNENTFNYVKDFDKHSISAVVGFAYEKYDGQTTGIQAAGYNFDYIQTIPATNVVGAETAEFEESLVSFFGRFNYSYADKYLVSLSARADGSSKFSPDNKYGVFPAVSVGWRAAEEDFLRNSDVISDLKFRFSYGQTGSNSGIGRYAHIGLIEPAGAVLDGGVITGFNAANISNSDLRWEKLVEVNPGVDAAFLNGRLTLGLDYYVRKSKDLLLNQPIPSVTGFTEALVNLGEVENKGFEIEFGSKNYSNSNFSWSTIGILTHNKNTLVNFAGANGLISVVDEKRPAEWIALEGHPISSFYGYVVSREIAPDYISDPFYPIAGQSQDIYVKDLNGDGVIDTDDRTILGSPFPDLIWSITNNFTYNNFDFSFMFQGSHGAEVRNIDSQYIYNEFASAQDYVSSFPDADLVRERIYTSDDVQDASYVALRNLNIGYRIPFKVIERTGLKSARVYVGGQNLIYKMSKSYEGWNPEGINQGLDSPLTYGYQRGAAPLYRTYSVGLNIEF
ncbi:TonB-dependent receptor [uncultured Roseivirga sp.]|uniref:SusC/RagA family TonB-linked outer membrane protein n=1 Tax=uncultured Roseivirga sp. TaxID=543088 RepID=UPI0030DBCFC5